MAELHNIQVAMQKALIKDPWFAGIPVITQNQGDIDTLIKQKISRIGIACLVILEEAIQENPTATGPYFDEVRYAVEVSEQVTINRSSVGTRKPILDVCEHVACALHHFEYAPGKMLYISSPSIVPTAPPPPATSAYYVKFETSAGVDLAATN